MSHRILTILIAALATLCALAEDRTILIPLDITYLATQNYYGIKKGETVHFTLLRKDEIDFSPSYTNLGAFRKEYCLHSDNPKIKPVPVTNSFAKSMQCICKTIDDIYSHAFITHNLNRFEYFSCSNSQQRELYEDAMQYSKRMHLNDLKFFDSHLSSFIQGLVLKIKPSRMPDGRPCNLNVTLISDPDIFCFILYDGSIYLSTGLVASLRNEDELAAILCHETAHLIFDHCMSNIGGSKYRSNIRNFWASFTLSPETASNIISSSRCEWEISKADCSSLTRETTEQARSFMEYSGMNYAQTQEVEADRLAMELLEMCGYNRLALSSALRNIMKATLLQNPYSNIDASYTHPSLEQRIHSTGDAIMTNSPKYEIMISTAISDLAKWKYIYKQYNQALALIETNIRNGVASTNDYILAANCIMDSGISQTHNDSAMEFLLKAAEKGDESCILYKSLILLHLRMGHNKDACELMEKYSTILKQNIEDIENTKKAFWEKRYQYLLDEQSWNSIMLSKMQALN